MERLYRQKLADGGHPAPAFSGKTWAHAKTIAKRAASIEMLDFALDALLKEKPWAKFENPQLSNLVGDGVDATFFWKSAAKRLEAQRAWEEQEARRLAEEAAEEARMRDPVYLAQLAAEKAKREAEICRKAEEKERRERESAEVRRLFEAACAEIGASPSISEHLTDKRVTSRWIEQLGVEAIAGGIAEAVGYCAERTWSPPHVALVHALLYLARDREDLTQEEREGLSLLLGCTPHALHGHQIREVQFAAQ